jgi:Phosphoglucomutase/phosphomannomutase, alpha/beta/alpha domain III
MTCGKGAFVTPSDSVAIIAYWADVIPYFKKNGGVKGLARSMPTSKATDLVAKRKGVECFEVPTGKSFFLLVRGDFFIEYTYFILFYIILWGVRKEVLWKFDGCRKAFYLCRGIVWDWLGPHPQKGRIVGFRR